MKTDLKYVPQAKQEASLYGYYRKYGWFHGNGGLLDEARVSRSNASGFPEEGVSCLIQSLLTGCDLAAPYAQA